MMDGNPYALPDSWSDSSIGDVVLKAKQRDPRKMPNDKFLYVDVSSISNQLFRITGATQTLGSEAPSRARKTIQTNDVLFATVRPTLKRIAVVPDWLNGQIASTGYCVLRSDTEKVDSRYLYFYLITDGLNARMAGLERGANYPAVRDSDVKNSWLPLPPLTEQKKIAHILSTVQRAIEAQERIIQTTTELKKALMQKLFTEGLRNEPQKQTEIGPVPESWETKKVGEVAILKSGGTPSRKRPEFWEEGNIPWVKTGEVDYCTILATEEKITKAGLDGSSAKLFPTGTLLMAMYGQGITRGKVALLGIEASTNQACVAFFLNQDVDSKYLYFFFEYSYDAIRNFAHGANQKNLSADIIKSFPVSYPKDKKEQMEIVNIFSQLDNKEQVCRRKRMSLQDLFRTLLHELMTAKIRVDEMELTERKNSA